MAGSRIVESIFCELPELGQRESRDYLTELIEDIDKCLLNSCFATALTSSLSVPDICGRVENHFVTGVRANKMNQARYERWFDRYVAQKYPSRGWPPTGGIVSEENWPPKPGVTGADAYALRNAIVHGADFETPCHAARPYLEGFTFLASSNNDIVHNCYDPVRRRAYLDISSFCRDIVAGFEKWDLEFRDSISVSRRRRRLGKLILI
ncbi:hypothetical protein OU426_12825 [Frigidibacter sp. RF13]|uniref:hypothetical protein n=1 Tax=Frigidibacter sp. RF13 TaxID=2997340 RepID=UPI00226FEC72|nr:hypothetical protein [Frigidibacter sp. RF13]MCY1127740.1 hypothetical protein [Frigidibacter sp. RF13]